MDFLPLLDAASDFYQRGWMLGTSGNLSMVLERHPLRLAITPSGFHKGVLTPDMMVEIDAEGNGVTGASHRPSAEAALHVTVAKKTGAGAVMHTHSVAAAHLTDAVGWKTGLFIEGFEMLKAFDGIATHDHREWIPILKNSQNMTELSNEIERAFYETPNIHGFLLERHGLYTWGKNVDEARRHVEALEFLLDVESRKLRGGADGTRSSS